MVQIRSSERQRDTEIRRQRQIEQYRGYGCRKQGYESGWRGELNAEWRACDEDSRLTSPCILRDRPILTRSLLRLHACGVYAGLYLCLPIDLDGDGEYKVDIEVWMCKGLLQRCLSHWWDRGRRSFVPEAEQAPVQPHFSMEGFTKLFT